MSNDELSRLQQGLEQEIGRWRLPRGLEHDELVAEAMSVLWSVISRGAIIESPERWLLGVAKRKRKELARNYGCLRAATDTQLNAMATANHVQPSRTGPELEKSSIWNSLTGNQAYALTEALMYGRSVSAVAAEIKVNRSTVKSWIGRIPRRLVTDVYLQTFVSVRSR